MELFSGGHVLYFTGGFPPAQGGSCILNQNLLKGYDRSSYTVVTYNHAVNWTKIEYGIQVLRPVKLFRRFNSILLLVQKIVVKKYLSSFAKKKEAKLIIIAYPDLFFLELALHVSEKNNIPLVLYLHDTIYEAHRNTGKENIALKLQSKAFKNAALVCVMSTGMQKLYMDKYDLETYPLRHTFNHSKLEILPNSKDSKKKVFWGGAVYGINKASIAKFSGLLNKTDFTLELATNASRQRLTQFGVNFERVETSYYSNTNDYWDAILGSTCLLLALDKQEDTKIDFDEISTIFPTKAIEYMFSNIPILVICPEDYFLSRFFSENNCGLVVNDIDDETSILRAMKKVAELDATVKEKVNNAKKIADKLFNPELVRKGFKELLEEKLLMLNHGNKSTKV